MENVQTENLGRDELPERIWQFGFWTGMASALVFLISMVSIAILTPATANSKYISGAPIALALSLLLVELGERLNKKATSSWQNHVLILSTNVFPSFVLSSSIFCIIWFRHSFEYSNLLYSAFYSSLAGFAIIITSTVATSFVKQKKDQTDSDDHAAPKSA